MGTQQTGVRWREDTGWELRCPDCAKRSDGPHYWPLTDEFWDKNAGMSRCRACQREARNRRDRTRYQADPAYRDKALRKTREDRRNNPEVARIKRQVYYEENRERLIAQQHDRYWADPEPKRAAMRERYRAKRRAA